MKTPLLGLFILGFASLSFSQNNVEEEKLKDVVVKPLNVNYLNAVQDKDTPEIAKKLEIKAAKYDITESPVFNRNYDSYKVEFKEGSKYQGTIVALYDADGKIIRSSEKFKNVAIPNVVSRTVYKNFPGWTIHSDTYLVSYNHNKEVQKIYKLKIGKDNQRKTLRVNVTGALL